MAKMSESDVWDQDLPDSGRAGSMFVQRTPNLKQAVRVNIVRDDWDDDDDEELDGQQEKNWDVNIGVKASGTDNDGTAPGSFFPGRKDMEAEEDNSSVWEEANRRAPMPELIVASASTSQGLPPPPPAALQPTLRILKRPSTNTSTNNSGVAPSVSLTSSSPALASGPGWTSPSPRGTLAEREVQYQEARSRIFGMKDKLGTHADSASMSSMSLNSPGGVVIVRDPLGPPSEPELEPGTGRQDNLKVRGPGRPAKGFGERRREKK